MSEPTKVLGHKIRSGTRWTLLGSTITEFLNFAVGIVLARLLLPEDFGAVATVGVLTGIAGFFSGAGTGQGLVRSKEVARIHFDVVFTLQLLMGCVIYVIFVAIASPFADFFGKPLYHTLLLVSGLSFFLRPFLNMPTLRLHRDMRFGPTTIVNVLSLIVSSSLSAALAWNGYGPWSLVAGGLFGSLVSALVLNLYVRQRYTIRWDVQVAKELGVYGAKVATNNLIEHFRNQSLILILSKISGPSDVGFFNRSSSLSAVPMRVIGTSPYQAVFRALAAEQDNLDKSQYLYFRTVSLVLVYTLPLYALTWWLAEPGIRFIYGNNWIASAEPLAILAISGILVCIGNPSGAVIEARNRVATEIWLNISAWVVLIGGVVYGVRWGLVGVAWAVVAMRVLYFSSLTIVAIRELKGSFASLASAITPALVLNTLLIAVLVLADRLFFHRYAEAFPGLYASSMAAIGGIAYAVAFLFLPIGSLKTEAAKWRKTLLMRNP